MEELELGPVVDDESLSTSAAQSDVFSHYSCTSLDFGSPHPGDVVESASLRAVTLPRASFPLRESLPADLISEGKLSELQLEGVLFACQRHQQVIPASSGVVRAGFFIGDGAGVGKGRQIAGLIFDSCCRGRRKHLWFSTSRDLRIDAERDLRDLGCFANVMDGCKGLDKTAKMGLGGSSARRGESRGTPRVLFTTYSLLVSGGGSRGGGVGEEDIGDGGGGEGRTRGGQQAAKLAGAVAAAEARGRTLGAAAAARSGAQRKRAKKVSRLEQMVEWCGGDAFEGCIVFDECHKAKNLDGGTRVSRDVITLQAALPRARVLYCSATGVSDIKHMPFLTRLGLWGPGTSFTNFGQFAHRIGEGGMATMELLSLEMKAMGMQVSRMLGFKGCDFETTIAPLTPALAATYDAAARLWDRVRRCLVDAGELTKRGKTALRPFWGAHQRFFRGLCVALKTDAAIATAQAALAKGHSVVIGLQSTGEAAFTTLLHGADITSRGAAIGAGLGNAPGQLVWRAAIPSALQLSLLAFISTNFPTTMADDAANVDGTPVSPGQVGFLSFMYRYILHESLLTVLP